jgi:twitching motility two-component system response regulator PilH
VGCQFKKEDAVSEDAVSTILVVDDSATMREMIATLLQDKGWQVLKAGDGIEAQEKFQSDPPPDLVITDIVMPRLNGYELCRWLKSTGKDISNGKDIPVVLCTSKGEEFDRYWGMKQGADAYIAKPFQPKELIETVKQLLKT